MIYLTLFIYGFTLFTKKEVQDGIREYGKTFLFLSAITIIGFLVWYYYFGYPLFSTNEYIYFGLLKALCCWYLLLSLMYIGFVHLNHQTEGLAIASKLLMPFYILHQPIIVAIAYLLRNSHIHVIGKYSILVVFSATLTILISHFIVLRLKWCRFLFGVK
ncbi:hypothetical protein [Litchfieldia alkalitelluris]|uniref:hypothetical protein n=1 Tax=Litchfieldia alkalitelluris TaxID=304268 RepID=UPI000995E1B9|nr:hypothetical protein [Litchfieldia alkalitelluris]